MDIGSSAQKAQYAFADACKHVIEMIGEGVHISFETRDGAKNFFLDTEAAIKFYLGLTRQIEILEEKGSDISKHIIKSQKAFDLLMREQFKNR